MPDLATLRHLLPCETQRPLLSWRPLLSCQTLWALLPFETQRLYGPW